MVDSEEGTQEPESAPPADEQSAAPSGQSAAPSGQEALERLPEPQKQVVEQFFGAAMSMGNPLLQKINPQHITDALSIAREEVSQGYGDRRDSRRTVAIVGVIFLIAFLGFAALLVYKEQNDLLLELLKDLGLFLGGSGAGLGVSALWNRNR